MVQLLSLSPTPTLTSAALCHQDCAVRLRLSGELDWAAAGLKEERGFCCFKLLPVSGSPTAAVALDLTVALGSRLQLFSPVSLRTGLGVRSAAPAEAEPRLCEASLGF